MIFFSINPGRYLIPRLCCLRTPQASILCTSATWSLPPHKCRLLVYEIKNLFGPNLRQISQVPDSRQRKILKMKRMVLVVVKGWMMVVLA